MGYDCWVEAVSVCVSEMFVRGGRVNVVRDVGCGMSQKSCVVECSDGVEMVSFCGVKGQGEVQYWCVVLVCDASVKTVMRSVCSVRQ